MTAKLHHADLYGPRQSKYDALTSSSMETIDWQDLAPNAPHYLFMPQEQAFRQEYEAGWAVNEIFPINSIGIVTARDTLTIHFTEQDLKKTTEDFANLPVEVARTKYNLGEDARDWKVELAQRDLNLSNGQTAPILYRPYDIRQTYYTGVSRGFQCMPRGEVMRHMVAGTNIGLVTTRGTKDDWDCSVCNTLMGHKSLAAYDVNYLFPLWRYPTEQEAALGMEREANIAPAFIAELAGKIGETPAPEDIFHYAYAVFHAPTYRTRYAAFLKTDFPRLPLPPDADTFRALAALGAKLTALHLLEAPELRQHGIGYRGGGGHVVKNMREADRYVPPTPGGATGRVRLNETEHFDNVPPDAWAFQVGGYRPAAKWLDDRKDRALTEDDITHYRRMLAAMRDTAALLPAVDAAFLPLLAAAPADTA